MGTSEQEKQAVLLGQIAIKYVTGLALQNIVIKCAAHDLHTEVQILESSALTSACLHIFLVLIDVAGQHIKWRTVQAGYYM